MSEAVRDVCGGSGVPEQLTEEKVTRGNSDRLATSIRGHTKTWDMRIDDPFIHIKCTLGIFASNKGISEASP